MSMNKARITYRFDSTGRRKKPGHEEELKGEVIPLHQDHPNIEEPGVLRPRTDEDRIKPATIYDVQPLNQFTTDYGAWNSSFDIETQGLEEMIRKSNRSPYHKPMPAKAEDTDLWNDELFTTNTWESYKDVSEADAETGYVDLRSQRGIDEQADHISDFESGWKDYDAYGPLYDEKVTRGAYIRKKGGAPWIKIISSAGGAIVTGILFGAFVLSMFAGDENVLDKVNPVPAASEFNETAPGTLNPVESQIVESAQNIGVTTPELETLQVDIPSASFFVLQNGMFSDSEGVDQAIQALQNKGFTGASDKQENYYVYAGISNNRDDALLLSHKLQESGMETYIKTFEIPAVASIAWVGSADDAFENYIAGGNRLMEIITNLSLLHLGESQPSTLDDTTVQTLKSTHQEWTQLNTSISQGLPEEVRDEHQSMITAMNTALLSMEEYQKNPSASYLWQAQQSIMQYVITERKLLASISS